MYFITNFAQTMLQNVWVLYTGYRYHWSTLQEGLSLTYVGVMTAVVQGGLMKRIIAVTGERKALVIGLMISAVVMVGYGTATQGWMVYALIIVGSFGGISGPAAQSLITRHVPPNEQGALQGSLSGLLSVSYIFGPILAAWSFGRFLTTIPGIAFYEAAGFLLVALALAFRSFQIEDRLSAKAPA
jgi:DHA1 family tetracycline resistance protein-like MFS transporter